MSEPSGGSPADAGGGARPGREADSPGLERAADAISDGAPVEWDAESAIDVETREALRLIENVARLHRSGGGVPRQEREAELATWGNLQIRGALGAGAYGEVYRAYDPGLQREVALKLWSPTVRPRIIERLLEEARALARVRHPNVLLVHGADTHDGRVGMWTELLEGVTLEHLLVHHGVCDWREAAVYGMQLCRALSAVHATGLVHRDVKAANVMRERGGRIVLMDFGSVGQQTLSVEPGAALQGTDGNVSSGPQGTPLAMAPEVLAGGQATPASDVYSLGVLLYRQVCGRFPVEANSLDQLRERLALAALPTLGSRSAQVPLAFAKVIDRALERDPAARIATASELERLFAEALSADWDPRPATPVGPGVATPSAPRWRRWVAWSAAAVVVAALGAWWWHERTESVPDAQPMQFTLQLPPGEQLPQFANVVVSPDGSRVAFASMDSLGQTALWVRPFDALSNTRLPGTDGAQYPFWAPDSREIAFFATGQLKRVSADGANVRVVCPAALGRGGSWSPNGTILFAGSTQGTLFRVPAAGGTAVAATALDSTAAEVSHRWPWFLPDGEHYLYVTTPSHKEGFPLYVGSLRSGRRVYVGHAESGAVFTQGMLVYLFNQGLEARAFNLRTLRFEGEPMPISSVSGVGGSLAEPHASVSQTGTLVHTFVAARENRMAWLDTRTGATRTLAKGPFFDPAISPDGRRIAAERMEGPGHSNLWLVDATSGAAESWTSGPGLNRAPQWSPGGDSVVFSSNRSGGYELYVRATNGSLKERALYSPGHALLMWSDDWRPGGLITYVQYEPGTDYNVYELRGGTPVPIARTPAIETHSALSPDARWLAYDSNASGRTQIHVVDRASQEHYVLPGDGGMQPRWARGTGRLYYHTPTNVFFEVTPVQGQPPPAWPQRELFRTGAIGGFDVDPLGERLLCCLKTGSSRPEEIAVLVNLKAAAAKGL
ncbi:MAG: protein kinase [Candidatus Eisenbacteria bacterium]